MGQLELHHRGERGEAARHKLGRLPRELDVQAVHGGDPHVVGGQPVGQGAEGGDVGVELDLAGAVEQDVVVVREGRHLLAQPLVQ